MASRKNLPERVEARRERAAARSTLPRERDSSLAGIETEPGKPEKIESEVESQPARRDLKMWALFLGTVFVVTIARRVTDKGFSNEPTLTNFVYDDLSNIVGLAVVWVISTATISCFHRYFLGKKYDGQEPKVNDLTPSFYYLLIFALVVSILAILGAYSTPSDWQD